MNISVVVGNPKSGSRTLIVANALAAAIAEAGESIDVIDLAEHAGQMFAWPSDSLSELNCRVKESDLVIVGSPTYKASYTGLLKSFLDRYPHRGLQDVAAIPVMTGADKGHSMAPDVTLRPLLVELGAMVPSSSFYFETTQFDRHEALIADWISANQRALRSIRAASRDKAPVR